jgi:hypothetical protein
MVEVARCSSFPGRLRPLCAAVGIAVIGAAMACATPNAPPVGAEPTTLWEDATQFDRIAPAPLSAEEARRVARAHDAAHTCEQTARAMAKKDPLRGFAVMRECVLRTDFSDLEGLVMGPWAADVARAPDAALLFAHVIAVRGGDVENDLKLLRRRKMPVFSLQAALAEPSSYAGRIVIARGEVVDGRLTGEGRSFRLVETKVMAESEWVSAPGTARVVTRGHDETAQQPGVNVDGRGTVQRSARDTTEKVEIERNVSVKTGRSLLARVDAGEASLEPATDYIVVLRFEGERETKSDDGDVDVDGAGVVIGYFEPETGLFARLSR